MEEALSRDLLNLWETMMRSEVALFLLLNLALAVYCICALLTTASFSSQDSVCYARVLRH